MLCKLNTGAGALTPKRQSGCQREVWEERLCVDPPEGDGGAGVLFAARRDPPELENGRSGVTSPLGTWSGGDRARPANLWGERSQLLPACAGRGLPGASVCTR